MFLPWLLWQWSPMMGVTSYDIAAWMACAERV